MSKRLDLVGQKFGRLEVVSDVGNKGKQSLWSCVCDCGNSKTVLGNSLRLGITRSCGCLQRENSRDRKKTHGLSRISEYQVWRNMLSRCSDVRNKSYSNYGGRGIKVCDRWLESFENFLEDMGNCPLGMFLDRRDNEGEYTPENCRWVTREEQNNNTRRNVWRTYQGETKTISQWARLYNLPMKTLWARLKRFGWSMRRALNEGV
jgi:hypothetical protein